MELKNQINKLLIAFKNLDNKKAVLFTSLRYYKEGGFENVKQKIKEAYERGGKRGPIQDCNMVDAYFIENYPLNETNEMIFKEQQSELTVDQIKSAIKKFSTKPLISVIMPVYNIESVWLKKAVKSLQDQYYDNWELCAVDDCSTDGRVRDILSKLAAKDKRIKLHFSPKNGGISTASNISLSMASGEFAALMDNDDEITPDAFFWIVNEINKYPDADFIYSDECKCTPSGQKFEFVFKPDWSPETLLTFMYTGHLTVYKTKLLKEIGGFRSEYDFGQDFDTALRMAEKAKCIRHIERVLYLWRAIDGSIANGGKQSSIIIGANVAADAYHRRGIKAYPTLKPYCFYPNSINENNQKVSIIIPSDKYNDVINAIESITYNTAYNNYEIIVVCNSMLSKKIAKQYPYLSILKIVNYDKEFNFSDKCNVGAEAANGEILVFYQDSLRILKDDWLHKFIDILNLEGVGAVSPQIIRSNNTIKYAGIATGTYGLTGVTFNGVDKDSYDDYWTRHRWVRPVSVLSATCIAIKKSTFINVGKFDELNTPIRFSNADLSFKITENNLRCVYNPHTTLLYQGYKYWDSWLGIEPYEDDHPDVYMLKKWNKYLSSDPYFTDTMKRAMIKYLPHKFKIYYKPKDSQNLFNQKPNILLISHELSLTGAPIVLHNAAKAILESGGFPVVVSPKDGELRKTLVNDGIMVIIDPSIFSANDYFIRFSKCFDLIIVNTAVCHNIIKRLDGQDIPVLWWIHEGNVSFEIFDSCMPDKVGKNVKVYTVGNHSKKMLKKYRSHIKSENLIYGIIDEIGKEIKNDINDKIVFNIIGTIEERKAQEIFVRAVLELPPSARKKAQFNIIGKAISDSLINKIKNLCKNVDEINIIDQMDRYKLLEFQLKSNVTVSTSTDDPMPVVLTEAMMFSKVCITTDSTGTAGLIENGHNGFVFKTNDYKQLSDIMLDLINNPEKIAAISSESRKTFEENFSYDIFKENLLDITNELLSSKKED